SGYLQEARARRGGGDRSFWDIAEESDAQLQACLIDGTLAAPPVLDAVTTGYARARTSGPSKREWASVRDHVWFLASMVGDETLKCFNAGSAAALRELFASMSRARPSTAGEASDAGVHWRPRRAGRHHARAQHRGDGHHTACDAARHQPRAP